MRSSAASTTITSGFRFSVHTPEGEGIDEGPGDNRMFIGCAVERNSGMDGGDLAEPTRVRLSCRSELGVVERDRGILDAIGSFFSAHVSLSSRALPGSDRKRYDPLPVQGPGMKRTRVSLLSGGRG
jgi:hypothetical protein